MNYNIIKKLPKNIIQLISAGEIIYRPSSIIKELLENSIDANSSKIEIYLFNGGIDKIIINDNGVGISYNDINKSVSRYNTSKINSIDDIYNISTLGFRGEALYNISNISNLIIRSKIRNSNFGTLLEIKFGKIINKFIDISNVGTSIIVDEIFYNIPVKKKNFKYSNIELKYIMNTFVCISIISYNINLKIYNNNKILYNLKNTKSIKHRINDIYDDLLTNYGEYISYNNDDISIKGYISNFKFNSNHININYIYVNNRYVKNSKIHNTIVDVYMNKLKFIYKPFYFIFINIKNCNIDVNVDPKKIFIKINNIDVLTKIISNMIINKYYVLRKRLHICNSNYYNKFLNYVNELDIYNKNISYKNKNVDIVNKFYGSYINFFNSHKCFIKLMFDKKDLFYQFICNYKYIIFNINNIFFLSKIYYIYLYVLKYEVKINNFYKFKNVNNTLGVSKIYIKRNIKSVVNIISCIFNKFFLFNIVKDSYIHIYCIPYIINFRLLNINFYLYFSYIDNTTDIKDLVLKLVIKSLNVDYINKNFINYDVRKILFDFMYHYDLNELLLNKVIFLLNDNKVLNMFS